MLPSRVIHNVRTTVPFCISVTTISKKPIVPYKQMCIAMGAGPPEGILVLKRYVGSNPTVDINSVRCKGAKDRLMQTERHTKLENEEAKRMTSDLQNQSWDRHRARDTLR